MKIDIPRLNSYGEESLDGLDDFLLQIKNNLDTISKEYLVRYKDNSNNPEEPLIEGDEKDIFIDIVEQMFGFIHFNKDHPENHNILATNRKPYEDLQVFRNDRWYITRTDEFLKSVAKRLFNLLIEKSKNIYGNNNPLPKRIKEIIYHYNTYCGKRETVDFLLPKKLHMLSFNNQHMPKQAMVREKERVREALM